MISPLLNLCFLLKLFLLAKGIQELNDLAFLFYVQLLNLAEPSPQPHIFVFAFRQFFDMNLGDSFYDYLAFSI